MPMIEPVELPRAYLLLNHGPTVLVTSAHGGARNVMAAAWAMPLDFSPPKMLVVVDKNTWTRELIEASGEFALCIPSRAQAHATLQVGSHSGRDKDKFQASGLTTFAASKIGAPLIEGCLGWLECKLIPEPHNQQAYDLFIGEVVAAWAAPDVFSGNRWHFPADERRSVHYVAGGSFFATGEAFNVADPE
ncbi:flavin reductase family protein [Achromobacter mucicolens]|nr:flavin reductase family protein [Achromobacter mucicolens]MDG9971681.1 flavin reductase family protein [Achromobacter mucicolens]